MALFLKILIIMLLFAYIRARVWEFMTANKAGTRNTALKSALSKTFRGQRLPKHRYTGKDTYATLVSGGCEVRLVGCFYSPELCCYMYWAESNAWVKTLIPEMYLTQEPTNDCDS